MYHKQNHDSDGVFAPIILFSYVSYEYKTNLISRSPENSVKNIKEVQSIQYDTQIPPLKSQTHYLIHRTTKIYNQSINRNV